MWWLTGPVQICSSHTYPDLGRPGRSRGVCSVAFREQLTEATRHTGKLGDVRE